MTKKKEGNKIYHFENRAVVLELSVMIEDMLSLLLSVILKISNRRDSQSLGTKSSALGFNSKANLLLDMKYLEKNDRWKFQKFMEIRNQFAHNVKVETFEQCFLIVTGKDKLLKTYSDANGSLSIEEKLKAGVTSLGLDLIELGKNVIAKFTEEYTREKILEDVAFFTSAMVASMKNTLEALTEKSDLREFLLACSENISEVKEKSLDASFEEKNQMIKSIVPTCKIPELIRRDFVIDYFSDEEIVEYNLKKDDFQIHISI